MQNTPNLSEQDTIPIPHGAIAFHSYLQRHHLTLLDVSLASGVRYLTIWKIAQNQPVRRETVEIVRSVLQRLTGEPFREYLPYLVTTPLAGGRRHG
ncbi:MAG TPA: hypothetical protein VFA41_18360 [Ktedonobacteraceae bacterium]|jgi:hypothetical protein|nr:hypothetical protein [Ktedonobacteraceae bacterium]